MVSKTQSFIEFLSERLQSELPGWKAQVLMAPGDAPERIIPQDAVYRNSAVLLLLVSDLSASDFSLLFTLRSNTLRHHQAQISFPGGRVDEGETFSETALRETFEEVGIAKESVHIIGQLTPLYVPVSFSLIHPFVAHTDNQPDIVLNRQEVAEAFFIPLSQLADREVIKVGYREYKDLRMTMPYWDIHHVPLWGATAMIVSELMALYEEYTA